MDRTKSKSSGFLTLSAGALGVVYGDIGTSPLYTVREIFGGAYAIQLTQENILGALSLIFWALFIIVAVKYVVFVMHADNHGEGGIMALTALALRQRHRRKHRAWIISLGLFGTALFYGDGMITPAISVLGAMEGLGIATAALSHYVVPASILILLALFLIQRRGTERVGRLFGPIMLLWFLSIGTLGFVSLRQTPEVLAALNPLHGFRFLTAHQGLGFAALGAVVLAVTGAEALYADMGHFGKAPIRVTWFAVVFPSLILNYLGQGALLIRNPEAVQNPFYLLVPEWALYPMIGLATAATVIASQAVISGAFSLTHQAIQLDYLPRQRMVHTSESERGQIYAPAVNRLLLISVLALVLAFGSSSRLASAYGLAVVGTMVVTTLLALVVAHDTWRWPGLALLVTGAVLLSVDLSFLTANLAKLGDGGWIPLSLGLILATVMSTWKKGRDVLFARLQQESESLSRFLQRLTDEPPPFRPVGTAIFLTARNLSLPFALLRNYEHNQVIHQRVILLTMTTLDKPYAAEKEKITIEALEHNFFRITTRFGFMERPNVLRMLNLCRHAGLHIDLEQTTFFLGRETLIRSAERGLNRWEEVLFISMFRNAYNPTGYFKLPVDRVVELGTVIAI
ncbi:potassium transporter Kup [Methylococcus capsulatus]|jgi:KUP system potassium uptake protein|uniref:Probable potassium transport system protein Kup n=1 Tax=Methylococcus capsulatus (strain ATCC 33009 / NCIMB 11132 / Bath) TaxID=243233 RepID=KUP_METCA|nr:potassium transporter Kup [Methylococcus capsulatus]Q60A92.1 RecName: Full=Probable potassium transport system protein Kup [Methylococcus capsulatus str. Bath]AAU92977.1 potassium uptake protein, Kup system [Methylococcus capsulatus str. Bath]QXP88277.1 potassium transporter Kup [Methylococcus capsulatus]QXP94714.1 potassium transporter Kup [Methylococcus capsulatus]UQN13315.1 potassium transporter Kup [Methylococcus capsulatus]